MSEENNNGSNKCDKPNTMLTLEQALLAPLDSILKAPLFSARSFLNLLLQLGYPHHESGRKGDGHPHSLDFKYTQDGETQKLLVPALSIVPISPLAVESASFKLEMSARNEYGHRTVSKE